jgi:hypothetical protein
MACVRSAPILGALAVIGCAGERASGPDGRTVDASGVPDARAPDAPRPDAEVADAAAPDGEPAPAVPLPGFGAITGMCGVLDEPELTGPAPLWFDGELTFDERYDDPADRDRLTPGGVEILLDGNAGGSSVYSEVFAFEVLARCELAALIKTETEIVYDVDGKKADLLVDIDGRPVGVSVTRAVTFPFGDPYTLAAAVTLLDRKLDDILLARDAVSDADRWGKSMVVALAFDPQHAAILRDAWDTLDAETRADTLMIAVVTSGDDLFIYTDQ